MAPSFAFSQNVCTVQFWRDKEIYKLYEEFKLGFSVNSRASMVRRGFQVDELTEADSEPILPAGQYE